MRILSNLAVTGSITTDYSIQLLPASFSKISGSFVNQPSVGLWANEDLDIVRAHEFGTDKGDVIFFGNNKLPNVIENVNDYYATASAFYDCIVSNSLSTIGYSLDSGSYSYNNTFTESYGGTIYTGSISGSIDVYKWQIPNAGNVGSYGKLTANDGDYVYFWNGVNISEVRPDPYLTIIDSIISADCNPDFLNTSDAHKLVYAKMGTWAELLCKCLNRNEYVDIYFALQLICNFPDGDPTNNTVYTRRWKFRVRKTLSGKCIYTYTGPFISNTSGIVVDGDDVYNGRVYTQDTGSFTATPSGVEFLKIPSFESSTFVNNYYKFDSPSAVSQVNRPGLIYFNETESIVYVYNGTSWVSVGGGGELTKFTESIGNGTASIFTVTHSKNTRDVHVTVRETSAPYEIVFPTINLTSENTARIDFSPTVPSVNQYTVIIS
jgi:hypothetical protein